jgi:hypothetical protein
MQTLDDYKPTSEEEELTKDMPEQVALGYIRARRKDMMRRAFHNSPLDRGFPRDLG